MANKTSKLQIYEEILNKAGYEYDDVSEVEFGIVYQEITEDSGYDKPKIVREPLFVDAFMNSLTINQNSRMQTLYTLKQAQPVYSTPSFPRINLGFMFPAVHDKDYALNIQNTNPYASETAQILQRQLRNAFAFLDWFYKHIWTGFFAGNYITYIASQNGVYLFAPVGFSYMWDANTPAITGGLTGILLSSIDRYTLDKERTAWYDYIQESKMPTTNILKDPIVDPKGKFRLYTPVLHHQTDEKIITKIKGDIQEMRWNNAFLDYLNSEEETEVKLILNLSEKHKYILPGILTNLSISLNPSSALREYVRTISLFYYDISTTSMNINVMFDVADLVEELKIDENPFAVYNIFESILNGIMRTGATISLRSSYFFEKEFFKNYSKTETDSFLTGTIQSFNLLQDPQRPTVINLNLNLVIV